MLDALLQDIRYSCRSLRRSPGMLSVVVATLALAVGANTALFSVFNALVLRPLPVRDPQRLALISLADEQTHQARLMYASTYRELVARQHVFETLALYTGGGILRTEARGTQVDAGVESATPGYYDTVGVRPFLGRFISSADAPPDADAAPVVVVSYRFWQQQFGGDPRALGETMTVDGRPLTIIGVVPAAFHGLYVDQGADIVVPLAVLRQMAGDPKRPIRAWNVVGRLRSGVTLDQARAELATLWPSLREATMPPGRTAAEQAEFRRAQVRVESIATGFSYLRTRYANPMLVVVGLTTLLLMIGSVNVSGLLLARALTRGHQMAVRVALGASRGRLMQQLFVESLLLSLFGTVIALPIAWWGTVFLSAALWAGQTVPLALSIGPDARVLILAAATAIAVGLLIGLLPACLTTRRDGTVALQPGRTAPGSTGVWGKTLVVTQIALSLVLLVGAGLFARSVANLRTNDSTFTNQRVIWSRLWLNPGVRQITDEATYYSELTRQLSRIPGIEAVGLSYFFPAYFSATPATQVIARTDVLDATSDPPGIITAVLRDGLDESPERT